MVSHLLLRHFNTSSRQVLWGPHGVNNISDDIIVFGENTQEHDARLYKMIERLKDKQLRLSSEKCKYRINIIGNIVLKNELD